MRNYHLNYRGEPAPCEAATVEKCPLQKTTDGDVPHFTGSIGEARRWAEEQNARIASTENTVNTQNTAQNTEKTMSTESTQSTEEDAVQSVSYTVRQDYLEEIDKRMQVMNRRLERAGIEERFSVQVEKVYTELREDPDNPPMKRMHRLADVSVTNPAISYNGYSFLAKVDTTIDGSLVVFSAPGRDMGSWRPEKIVCDHYETKHRRKTAFLVSGQDGEPKMVGKSCLQMYTGLTSSALIPYGDDKVKGIMDEGVESSGEDASSSDDVLAAAALVVAADKGYKNADFGEESTKNKVLYMLHEVQSHSEQLDAVDVKSLRAEISEELKHNDSEWASNVKTLMGEEHVSHRRHLGVLVSALVVIAQKQQRERNAVQWDNSPVADVGEKVAGLRGRVHSVYESEEHYGYHPTLVSKITIRTEDGKRVFWKTQSADVPEENEQIEFGGTVKSHDTWKGNFSTRMIRLKWKAADPRDDAESTEDAENTAGSIGSSENN